MSKKSLKSQSILFLVVCLTILIMIVSKYYFEIDIWSIIQGRNTLSAKKITKLESNEISEIIIFTKSSIEKSTVISQIKKNDYTYIDQFGAVRVFEKNNVRYVLSGKKVYKYFIKWKFAKLY